MLDFPDWHVGNFTYISIDLVGWICYDVLCLVLLHKALTPLTPTKSAEVLK